MRKLLLITAALLVTLALLSSPFQATAQNPEPEMVIRSIIEALNARDIETALSLIAEDATLKLVPPPSGSTGMMSGKAEFRDMYEDYIARNEYLVLDDFEVEGNRVTWSAKMWDDHFQTLGVVPLELRGEGIVEAGLLKAYTSAMTDEALAKLESATWTEEKITPYTAIEITCKIVPGQKSESGALLQGQGEVQESVIFSGNPLFNGTGLNFIDWKIDPATGTGTIEVRTTVMPEAGAGVWEVGTAVVLSESGTVANGFGYGSDDLAGLELIVDFQTISLEEALALVGDDPRVIEGNPCYPAVLPENPEVFVWYGEIVDTRPLTEEISGQASQIISGQMTSALVAGPDLSKDSAIAWGPCYYTDDLVVRPEQNHEELAFMRQVDRQALTGCRLSPSYVGEDAIVPPGPRPDVLTGIAWRPYY